MDLRQLRTFRSVAELGSLSKASDRLRVAQPALSRHIKLLEHELRVELFTRNGRGMILTSAGQMLLDRTSGVVRQIEQVRDDLQSIKGTPSGNVVLGLVPTVSCVLSAGFARRIVERFPDISLRIVESYGGHLVEWLHRGEMDLAIIYGPSTDLHLSVQTLGRDDLVAVGPHGCGLAQRKQVDIGWLAAQKLVLPSNSHGLRVLIEKAAARKSLSLNVSVEADSFRVLTSFVEEGLGFTVLPQSAVRTEVAQGRLEIADIVKPTLSRELILAAPADRPPSIATASISSLIRKEIQSLADDGLWNIRLAAQTERSVARGKRSQAK
ncbi:LysR family transcriptional regulator [Bradyrhizobium prioriisuperbiae]|uniref:LysR family transcriptional regulator n=1 Tax=Bradyrhizobium prioriisuperbiae TaxID=2854389 RepID=UPI0028E63AD9|nr:LysR substrate-binding domain-containing protein [Bradyrhizobium prioritasuperba]